MIKVGTRVEIATPASGPQTGAGRRGVVEAVHHEESSVTGTRLRWVSVDVRLDSGALVAREPRQLRVVTHLTHEEMRR